MKGLTVAPLIALALIGVAVAGCGSNGDNHAGKPETEPTKPRRGYEPRPEKEGESPHQWARRIQDECTAAAHGSNEEFRKCLEDAKGGDDQERAWLKCKVKYGEERRQCLIEELSRAAQKR